MNDGFLGNRRKALEEEFFRRQDAALIAQQRSHSERHAARAALAAASRITDEALLDQLVELGINPDTLTALSLVPLVAVAWADGKLEDTEKQAILVAARAVGLEEASAGHRLLEGCFSGRPPARLMALWRQYIKSVSRSLSREELGVLKDEVLQHARGVAEAAGGLLGLGLKVSRKEEALLAELGRAFNE